MNKLIKIGFLFLFFGHAFFVTAQSWQQVMINYDSKCMSFNPFDSSLWLVKKYPARLKNGVLTEYNISIVPDFNFVGFLCSKPVFTSSGTYCFTTGTNFFYRFDGNTFQRIYLPGSRTMKSNMAVSNDTLYLEVNNPTGTLMYFQDQIINESNIVSDRLQIGQTTFYNSYNISVANVDFNQNTISYFYTTTPLNHFISDLLIKPQSDTLYFTAVDKILKAKMASTVGSITTNNSLQMPNGHPMKIRFDQDENLWTLFGDPNCNLINHNAKVISKYNPVTNTWEQSKNISELLLNLPDTDSNNVTTELEVDSYNNIWLLIKSNSTTKYFMLQQGDAPSYLGLQNPGNAENINIFPNPTSDHITISEIPLSLIGSNATITDVNGKQILDFEITQQNQQIDCSTLKKGVYFLRIGEQNQKIIIE
jgi:hypothetical protein